MLDVTACIVLYQNDKDFLFKTINSFLNSTLKQKLYLIDNSPTDKLSNISNDIRVEYTFNNANMGFSAGHNIGIKKAIQENSKFHIVLNPDIEFKQGTLEGLKQFMDSKINVGLVAPKTLYPNGDLQYLCRLLPTPFDFFLKKLMPKFILILFREKINKYEFIGRDYDKTMEVPFLSGCFMFFRTEIFNEVGLFDENIFMYTEDIDICRRVSDKYKTIYYPKINIIHGYERGSSKNLHLLIISIKSAVYYFNKWGWFFDKKRKEINKKALSQFK